MISVVGVAFRLPGASTLEQLEAAVAKGRPLTGPVPKGRFRSDLPDFDSVAEPASRHGCFLDEVDLFDARLFGITPFEARRMDPQQRLLLETSWRALEDAGLEPLSVKGSRTGVFVGSSNHDYAYSLSRDPDRADLFSAMGNAGAMLSNRVSHAFDLRGPSFTVDTACSSAAVAIHLASESLKRGECDLALCAGVNLILSPHLQLAFARGGMLSAEGAVRAFDSRADGYVRGEAAAVVILKRTADLLAGQDRAHCELLGSALTQDGRTGAITAPRLESQVEAILGALRAAGVGSDELGYLEAHGTGTKIGDPVEYHALASAMREGSSRARVLPCPVGTAKTLFGHAEPASAMVGLLHVIASFRRGMIPSQPGFNAFNPAIREDREALELPREERAWPVASRRIAGLNSFGFGGTNAHLIIADSPAARASCRVEPAKFERRSFWKGEGSSRAPEAGYAEPVLAGLVSSIAATLGIDTGVIDPDQPVLALGVDSLDLLSLLHRAQEQHGVRVPLEFLLKPDTSLRKIAERIGSGGPPERHSDDAHSMLAPAKAVGEKPDKSFAAAYQARTAASKSHVQDHRATLADNRGCAGFRLASKELCYPIVAERAHGSRIRDVDGNEYVDMSMGFGVHLFGHSPPLVKEALLEALEHGVPVGPMSPLAGEVANLLSELTGLERFAFCNSGTEAIMLACRLARAVTSRDKIVIFEGSYHGTFDGLLVRAGQEEGFSRPLSPGVPASYAREVHVLPWASQEALDFIRKNSSEIAAVLVEPVQSRRPWIQDGAFLKDLRSVTEGGGNALIFDEVITGFRASVGGAQEHFGVRADLAVYGKVIGGGLPIGVVGGAARFLDRVDGGLWRFGDSSGPQGDLVFLAGTFSKHPLTLAAARAVLRELKRDGARLLETLNAKTTTLRDRLNAGFQRQGHPVQVHTFGSLLRFRSQASLDGFFSRLMHKGFYIWEGRTLFLSTAHTDEDLRSFEKAALAAANEAFPRTGERPLLPDQGRFLELASQGPDEVRSANNSFALRLRGALDAVALEQALRDELLGHEIFRASFENGRMVLGNAVFVMETRDLSREDLPERELRRDLGAFAAQVFDLSRPPLARFRLYRIAENEHVLAVVGHALVLDGFSLGILFTRAARAYSGEPVPPCAPLPRLQAPARPEDEAFWLDELGDRGLRRLGREAGSRAEVPLRLTEVASGKSREALLAGARELKLTPFAYLFSRFGHAYQELTGAEVFSILVPIARRTEPGTQDAVGCFTNLLPIPQKALGLEEVLERNRILLPSCYAHSTLPYAELKKLLARHGKATEDPGVLFNLEPISKVPCFRGLELSEVDVPRATQKSGLAVHVIDTGSELRFGYDFKPGAFSEREIRMLARRVMEE